MGGHGARPVVVLADDDGRDAALKLVEQPDPDGCILDVLMPGPARLDHELKNPLTAIRAGAAIEFTGHGYKGTIGADSNLPINGVSVDGLSGKNFVGITLTKR